MFYLKATLNFQVLKVINSKIKHNAKYRNITGDIICTDFCHNHHEILVPLEFSIVQFGQYGFMSYITEQSFKFMKCKNYQNQKTLPGLL